MYNFFKNYIDLQVWLIVGMKSRRIIINKDNKRFLCPFILPTIGIKVWNVNKLKYNLI